MSALPRSKVPQRSRGRAAGQPVALRRPSIHLIPLSARSFAMGGVDLSKWARSCVEGRWLCRGQVAVARAGRRVEAVGQPQFSKNWLTFGSVENILAQSK